MSSKLPRSLGGKNQPRRLPRPVRLDFQNVLSATGPPGGRMGLTTTVGHPGLPEYLSVVYTPDQYIDKTYFHL